MPELWVWLYLGLPTLLAGMFQLRGMVVRRRRLRHWEESVRPLCETVEVKRTRVMARQAQVTARSGPNEVRITSDGPGGTAVLVQIEVPGGFSDMRLSTFGGYGVSEIEIGDKSFDAKLVIEGPARPVAARLDEAMRRLLLSAIAHTSNLQMGDGLLQAKVDEKSLPQALPILLDIGRRLAEPMDVDRQIAWNARHDPFVGVRLFNLRHLARLDDPDTLAVLRDACSDQSPEVRLRAAITLGKEGYETLWKLAQGSGYDALSAQAVSHLARALPLDSLKDLLARALRKELVQTASVCVEELGHRRGAAVDVLEQVLAKERSELATAAALALGRAGEASAEPALLQALESEDDDVRKAAMAALGRVGTAAAVQPLKEAAERSWLALSLRRSANRAIAEIQARLQGAAPGQLSLSEGETGRLSLAPADAGQLSLAPHATHEPAEPIDRSREQPGSRLSI